MHKSQKLKSLQTMTLVENFEADQSNFPKYQNIDQNSVLLMFLSWLLLRLLDMKNTKKQMQLIVLPMPSAFPVVLIIH